MAERFVAAARINPASIAIADSEDPVSYGDLLTLVLGYAQVFSQISDAPRVLVGLPQRSRAYAAELGAVFAGGTFCPVDLSLPDQRLRQIAEVFDPHIVCADGTPRWAVSYPCLASSALPSSVAAQPTARPAAEIAYVIFTSGSTGLAKGVAIRSRSLLPFFNWLSETYCPTAGDRWAQFSRLGFDLSIVDLFGALSSGATLVPVTRLTDRLLPARFIQRESITIWHSVPSLIPSMIEGNVAPDALASLRLASFCGEPLYRHYLEGLFRLHPSLRVFNTYGPTEGTLFCTYQELQATSYQHYCQDTAAIGAAIPGWRLTLSPVENIDQPGLFALTLVGEYLAAGYLGGTLEDAARFTEVPDGERMLPAFRTGDVIRSSSGALFFECRSDRQIKLRGYRLELGEVERAILALGASEVHAFLHGTALQAAVRGLSNETVATLPARLGSSLPMYAIPTRLFPVTEFPRLSSGKIDYVALKRISAED